MNLTEFLLARIAEDEESTRTASTPFYREMFNGWHRGEVGGAFIGFTDRFTPERVLAECETKRHIVEYAAGCEEIATLKGGAFAEGMRCASLHHLRRLAMPYADHPDYRQEWKP